MSRILVVDDDANIAKSVMRLLHENNFNVLTATTSHEASTILANEHDIGVVISDQRVSKSQKTNLFIEMQTAYPLVRRVLLTGYTEIESLRLAVNIGGIFKLLFKPWDDEDLIRCVQEGTAAFKKDKDAEKTNLQLTKAKLELENIVEQKKRILDMNIQSIQRYEKIFEQIPIGVVAIGDDGMIALANPKFCKDLDLPKSIGGISYIRALPNEMHQIVEKFEDGCDNKISISGNKFHVIQNSLKVHDIQFGKLLSLRQVTNED